jgi:hypothetical protein
MCHAAIAVDERLRGELERRLEARLAKDPDHGTRRYLLAVRAGNRAAQGDRAEFDRVLAEEKNVTRLSNLSTTLSRVRQPELLRELREVLVRRTDRSAGLVAAVELAEMDRDHARAAAAAEAVIAKVPRGGTAHAHLVRARLMLGDLDAARAAAARGMTLANPWVHLQEGAACVALLDGDRDRAATIARDARVAAIASGYGETVYPMLAGVEAVLAGDAAKLAAARARGHDPNGAHWTKLTALIS